MKKTQSLTCGFMLVRNGQFGPCGNKATMYFKKAPLCDECSEYVKGRGENIFPITEEFEKKAHASEERKAKKMEGIHA